MNKVNVTTEAGRWLDAATGTVQGCAGEPCTNGKLIPEQTNEGVLNIMTKNMKKAELVEMVGKLGNQVVELEHKLAAAGSVDLVIDGKSMDVKTVQDKLIFARKTWVDQQTQIKTLDLEVARLKNIKLQAIEITRVKLFLNSQFSTNKVGEVDFRIASNAVAIEWGLFENKNGEWVGVAPAVRRYTSKKDNKSKAIRSIRFDGRTAANDFGAMLGKKAKAFVEAYPAKVQYWDFASSSASGPVDVVVEDDVQEGDVPF